MARLTRELLDFARNHITKFYDSDFFPKPFEYQAIWANWDEVVTYLTCNEIEGYPIEQPRIYAAPKPNGSFRVVHQLDPINTLIYTALAYTIGEKIEAARVPIAENVACSYRIEIESMIGTFFANGAGYGGFIDKCNELAATNPYVLVTDITDYYNQIYVHRLQNAIEFAHVDLLEISKNTERFLLDLNGSVSQGVPVGPAASIIMAEALLIDVDNFIHDTQHSHTRYVDDIRIFGQSEVELESFLERLTLYLYENHRLTLAGGKTHIITSDRFISEYLKSPEEIEKSKIHKTLGNINSLKDAYGNDFEENIEEEEIRPTVLTELMAKVISSEKLDLGLARHILRRCRRYRIRAIVNQVLENITFLSPVISDVILYLSKVTNKKFIEINKDKLVAIFTELTKSSVPFVREWIEYYIASDDDLLAVNEIRNIVFNSGSTRNQALAARLQNSTHWVRRMRGRMSDLSAWDRRAVIRSGVILSQAELNSWLNAVEKNSTNFTE